MNKKILLLTVFILLFISILRFSENAADFSTFNSDWNGGVQIRKFVSENHNAISIPARYDLPSFEPGKTALVVLGPKGNFSEKDIELIKKFVADGGLLILADDFGSGNELLNRFTTSVSFSNMLLVDDVSFWKNSTFPVVSTGIENVSNITLNYPASLVITDKSVKVLAYSGRFSFLTKTDFKNEHAGPYPVIADIPFGQGKIVAIADPSIFINSMLQFQDNKFLLGKLVENRTTVLFDDTGRIPPIPAVSYMIRTNPYFQYLLAVIVISLAYLYMKRDRISIFRREKPISKTDGFGLDEENIISDILKRHKWDERKFALFRNKLKERK